MHRADVPPTRVDLFEPDLDDFDVTANVAFERAEIVIRLWRWFDPSQRCQATALGTRRPIQLNYVDVVWLSRAHDTSSPRRAGAVSHPHRCHPFKGQRRPIKISKFGSWQHLLTC